MPKNLLDQTLAVNVVGVGLMPVTIIVAFGGFGWISRRFEWQADAFAAKQLSRDEPGAAAVTQEAVEAMCGALGTVAALNHMNPGAKSFRHGSISLRQQRLRRLVGVPLDRLPIDRTARWMKGAIVVGLAIVLAGIALEPMAREKQEERWEVRFEPSVFIQKWPQSTLKDAPR